MTSSNILNFWFEELEPKDWYKTNPSLDTSIKNQFEPTVLKALQGELFEWRTTTEGRVAEIIVLDQFTRNIYRDSPKAFIGDNLALALAQEAVYHGFDQSLTLKQRQFLYMPYMHSESKIIHNEALKLFGQPGLEMNLEFEIKHKVIIDQFGRYPHRNKVLNRESTPEEIAFLKLPGSSF